MLISQTIDNDEVTKHFTTRFVSSTTTAISMVVHTSVIKVAHVFADFVNASGTHKIKPLMMGKAQHTYL